MSAQGGVTVTVSMTAEEAREFVRKLADDDEFRERLERDPHATLAEHNIFVRRDALPGAVALPAKQEVQAVFAGDDAGGEEERPSWSPRLAPPPDFSSCFMWGIAFVALHGLTPAESTSE